LNGISHQKISLIKNLLKKIHEGADPEKIKEEFGEVLREVKPWEIAFIEQELVKDGVSVLEIARLCDVHVDLFRESLVSRELREVPDGHPLSVLIEEDMEAVKLAEQLSLHSVELTEKPESALENVANLLAELLEWKRHFMREQLLIFPYIERRGLTAVSRVLWSKQDEVIKKLKAAYRLAEKLKSNDYSRDELAKLSAQVRDAAKSVIDMVFRETRILYPTLKALLSNGEWAAIKEEEAVTGYFKVKPKAWRSDSQPVYPYELEFENVKESIAKLPGPLKAKLSGKVEVDDHALTRQGDIALENGFVSPEELNAVFKALPLDISFIDAEDRLRFYSAKSERIFPRTKTVLGRPVYLCHPPRSVHLVRRIIEDFKAGERSSVDFWINFGGRLIYIRYFPVRGTDGKYLGTLEVVQDITSIRELKGEKRLLN